MNAPFPRILRVGAGLSVLVALLAFLVRSAAAQEPTATSSTPQRLSLGDAARLAAQQAAGVQSARLLMTEAQARVIERRADLLPNVSGYVEGTSHTLNSASFGFDLPSPPGQPPILDPNGQIIGPVKLLDVRGRASESLFDYAAIQRVRAARVGVGAASAGVAAAAQQAATGAAAAYLRALRAEAQLEARIADSSLADDLLGIARQQLSAGVGVALDVTRAQAQLAGIRAQLIASRNDRERTLVDLRRGLNLPVDAPLTLTDSLAQMPATETVSERAAVDQALRTRPDLKALDEQARAAQQQVAAIKAERLPSLNVFGDDGTIGKSTSHMLATYDVGVQVSVPIFEGFRREGRVQEQEAAAHEVEVRRKDLALQVEADVHTALLDLASAREQVEAARERLRLAEQEVAQARERFRAGVAGNADVITASLALNGSRNLLIDALTAYQAARVSLARAEGTVTDLR